MERRRFIVKAGGVLAAAGAVAAIEAPHVIAQPKVQWRMPSAYPPATDVFLGSAQRLAKAVDEMSGGRFRIEVFPAGQLMPPLGIFDAASQGSIEAFQAASLFWAAKEPAAPWFTNVPFGLNAAGMAAWCLPGDGLKLWEEAYAPFNLLPRPGMSTGPQMAGWFRKKINTLADFKGLKMRIPGLGGQVVDRAGGTAVLMPGGEVFTALERGVIDASEWSGPYDDMKLGLHNTARYYYYPGWHEPGATLEFVFNKKAYETLPVDLQRMLDYAAGTTSCPASWNTMSRRDRPREAQDRVQGQGRDPPVAGAGATRPQEAGGRGRQGGVREEPDGEEGVRLLHEVPGAAGRLVPHLGRRVLPVRGHVTRQVERAHGGGAAVVIEAPSVIAQRSSSGGYRRPSRRCSTRVPPGARRHRKPGGLRPDAEISGDTIREGLRQPRTTSGTTRSLMSPSPCRWAPMRWRSPSPRSISSPS